MCRLLLNHIQAETIQQNPTKNVSPAAKMPQNITDKIWRFFKYYLKTFGYKNINEWHITCYPVRQEAIQHSARQIKKR